MIAKIPKPGRSFGGCVRYNLLKQDAVILEATGVRTDKVKHVINDFNIQRKMNPALGQAVGHIALSWSPNDLDKLDDEVMKSVALDYLAQMKIDNTQILIVRHKDKAHPHLHIIYNRVNDEGKTISDNFHHLKNIRICKALTLKHSFFIAKGKEKVNRRQLNGSDKVKYELYDTIREESKKVSSLAGLEANLKSKGISINYKLRSGTTEVQGISFTKGNYTFKGSEIDRSMSYTRLTFFIEQYSQWMARSRQRNCPSIQARYGHTTKIQSSNSPSLAETLLKPDNYSNADQGNDFDSPLYRKRKRKRPGQRL